MSKLIDGVGYGWTQPMCAACYAWVTNAREPHRMLDVRERVCCWCGKPTTDGIWYRVDPAEVGYPTPEEQL